MKFKLKITKDILQKSMMCGVKGHPLQHATVTNCAFAAAYNELIPNVHVSHDSVSFRDKSLLSLGLVLMTPEQTRFVKSWDRLTSVPHKRLLIPERTFDVEIPDEVISYWYKDRVDFVQQLINSPVFKKTDILPAYM